MTVSRPNHLVPTGKPIPVVGQGHLVKPCINKVIHAHNLSQNESGEETNDTVHAECRGLRFSRFAACSIVTRLTAAGAATEEACAPLSGPQPKLSRLWDFADFDQ